MSTSLVFGVLITIGVIALLVVAGLLTGGKQSTSNQESVVQEPAENRELARVNGARPQAQEQTAVPAYPRLNGQRELRPATLSQERERAQERQEDLQARYEQTLQELMTLLQREQRPSSPTISLEEEDDPYQASPRPRRQIDDALPSVARLERNVVASSPSVPEPETAEVQAHYSLVPNDEEAREKLPGGLSIPVSITLDGNVELEHVPRMRIEVVIHLQ
jgi:hypothetical protein